MSGGTALYDEYTSYTKSRYGTAKNSTLFGRDMDSRFSKKRTNTGIVYTNIKLQNRADAGGKMTTRVGSCIVSDKVFLYTHA